MARQTRVSKEYEDLDEEEEDIYNPEYTEWGERKNRKSKGEFPIW